MRTSATSFLQCLLLLLVISAIAACKVYTFKDVNFPADIKTVKLGYIENKARLINAQLASKLNEKLQQKIVGQTPLTRSTSDEADYVITGYINDYTVTTSGIANQQVATNNLSVGVHIILKNNKLQKQDEYDVNKTFPFSASLSLNDVEQTKTDEIVKGISDEIFNRLFSNW